MTKGALMSNDKIIETDEDTSEQDKVIETDEDTTEQDRVTERGLYPYNPAINDIDLKEDPMSVFQYIRKYAQNQLIIDPDFQRNIVWKPKQKSWFIESVILNFPLPPFYLNQDKKGNLLIIDGLQRTTTLIDFMDNKFVLSELEALPDYNGLNFKLLPPEIQSKIEDKKLLLYILKPTTPTVVIYDMFNRINTGGTQLNRQEVRNCIFRGESTRLLKKLANEDVFKKAIDDGISDTRMKAREAILRYLAFKIKNYSAYNGDMSEFIEDAMKQINQMNNHKIEALEADFRRVMQTTFNLFGKKNFRIPSSKTRGAVNIAILESVAHYFSNVDDNFIKTHKTSIVENFRKLIENPEYIDGVRFSTGDKNRVFKRFELATKILGAVK
jgi:hypothetical protein